VKKIKQSYPRRREMLTTPFEPLSDDEFRQLVASGLAIPCQQGTALFVAKWREGPGLDAEAFLVALRAQGSKLAVRRFKADVNIRVVRSAQSVAGARL
jgi:hypothetical protein